MISRETHEVFVRFLEAAPASMAIVNNDGRIYLVNPALEKLFGYDEGELIGKNVDLLVPVASRENHASLRQEFNSDPHPRAMAQSRELHGLRKDGTEVPVEISLSPLQLGEDLLVIAAIHDLSARKQQEQERLQQTMQLQQSQKLESLGVLAGGIAHDFNNLLTSILGHTGLALKQVAEGSPLHASLLSIERTSERAAELIMQMLAYSGKGHFVIAPVNLSQVIQEMTNLLQAAISKKAVIRYDFFAGLPTIMADVTQIRQVIMNLITNASDAIGERSGIITLRTGMLYVDHRYFLTTRLFDELPEGDYVYMEVSDTGAGMDAATQAKIFDPFFTTKFSGRGLGLAAVQGIVRGHNGLIKIYSEIGRGTTFKVLFPYTNTQNPVHDQRQDDRSPWRHGGTILVVDDEESIRALLCNVLLSKGFNVLQASDGREALSLFADQAENISLILLDLTMPHLGGEETFRELRRIDDKVPVILMSGYTEYEVTSQFAGKGIAGFVQKPFRLDKLLKTLQDVLEP
ncbi:MAG: PAS domain S-box protein [Pseudomonadales bacterium]|nr:PAS domain S-box protein [Pseudomonadales bacterium]